MSAKNQLRDDRVAEFDAKSLRTAFGAFATGVTIVTARDSGVADVGLTANSFSSLSLTPPMVLWSLSKTSSSIDAFRGSDYFAVHVLSAEQETLSTRFATKGIERFAGVPVDRGPEGIPMLRDCAARFVCRTAYQHEGGDHVIFVGQVLDFTHTGRLPLVFHSGRYGMVFQKEAAQQDPAGETGSSLSPNDLLYHVSNAYFRIRRGGIQELRRRGWTGEEYATLSVLGRENGLRLAEIRARSEARGRPIAPETIERLVTRGLISTANPMGAEREVWLTPAGRQALIEIIAIHKASEAHVLEGFDLSEVQLLKQFLRRIVDG